MALGEVFIPPNVLSIGSYAFQNCTNLEKIVFAGSSPTGDSSAFKKVKAGCTAYVPWGTEGWGVSIPGTWNGINIAYLFTGKKEVDESDLPDTIVVQSDAEVTVRSQRTPAELKAQVLELMARAEAMNRERGQNPSYYKVSGVCDEANGTITLWAAIDAAKIGLEETTSEVVGADALATFKADGTMRLTSAKEGFYYGLAAAGRLEDLDAAVDAVKADGLTRADGGGVNLSAARPSGGSAFFKIVVSDRTRDD